MTEINHNSLAGHHAVDEAPRHPGDREKGGGAHGGQILDDHSHDSTVGSVTISFNAHMRLRAYEDQKVQLSVAPGAMPENSLPVSNNSPVDTIIAQDHDVIGHSVTDHSVTDHSANESSTSSKSPKASSFSDFNFSERMTSMLSEVENNIVQSSEPGYQYLVNMLNNYKTSAEDPQQLQEIMRREEFYLNRRKPFMESVEFQSYSQVLSQFSNIIERQQYSSQH